MLRESKLIVSLFSFISHHLSHVLTADTQSSCNKQSCGSGTGNRSTYSISMTSSNEIERSLRCEPSRSLKNSPKTINSNSTDVEASSMPFSCNNVFTNVFNSAIVVFAAIVYGMSGTAYLGKENSK